MVENSSQICKNYCSNKKLIWSLLMRITQTYRSKKYFPLQISIGLLKPKEKCTIDFSKELFFVSNDKKCPFRNKTIQFLKENNLSQRQLQQLDSYSLIEEFIQDGKGIAFLPIKNDKLVPIENVPIEKLAVHFFTNQNSFKQIPDELFD